MSGQTKPSWNWRVIPTATQCERCGERPAWYDIVDRAPERNGNLLRVCETCLDEREDERYYEPRSMRPLETPAEAIAGLVCSDGEALYWNRVQANVRLRDLAKRLGITPRLLSDYEHGRQEVTPEFKARHAAALEEGL